MSKTIEDDIAYMRSLAEAGRQRPVLNGGALFWAGICFGAASLIHYGFLAGLIPFANPSFYPVVWLSAGVIYAFLCWLSISASIRRFGKPNEMNRVVGSMWGGVGLSIFVLAMCLMVAGLGQQALQGAMTLMAPTILILYALGWWVMSDITRQGWLRWVSLCTLGGAVTTAFFAGQSEQFLLYAACLILFATVPGIVLMRAEKGLSMADEPFTLDSLDDVIHGRLRLGIMAYLSTAENADFNTLKARTQSSDGNLSIQLRKLEEAGYVGIDKSFVGKKPLTTVSLTDEGRVAYIRYLDALRSLIGGAL